MYQAKHVLLLCLGLLAIRSNAQYAPTIRSVRPGQALAPQTVGTGILQFHIGGYTGWNGKNNDTSEYFNKFNYANAFVSYGINNKLELNLLAETRNDKIEINNRKLPSSGLSLAALGLRYNLYDGGFREPSVGLQGLLKFPAQSADYKTNNIAPRLLFLMSYDPTYIVSMTANVGIDFTGNNTDPIGLYAFKTSFRLSPQLGTFIETYGSYDKRYVYNHIDLGLYYFITNDFQVDAHGGLGIRKDQYEGFLSIGLAFRIATRGIPQQIQYDDYYR